MSGGVITLQRAPISPMSVPKGLKLHLCEEYAMKRLNFSLPYWYLWVSAHSTTWHNLKLWMQMARRARFVCCVCSSTQGVRRNRDPRFWFCSLIASIRPAVDAACTLKSVIYLFKTGARECTAQWVMASLPTWACTCLHSQKVKLDKSLAATDTNSKCRTSLD